MYPNWDFWFENRYHLATLQSGCLPFLANKLNEVIKRGVQLNHSKKVSLIILDWKAESKFFVSSYERQKAFSFFFFSRMPICVFQHYFSAIKPRLVTPGRTVHSPREWTFLQTFYIAISMLVLFNRCFVGSKQFLRQKPIFGESENYSKKSCPRTELSTTVNGAASRCRLPKCQLVSSVTMST
jgi:hypothetical protein